MRSFFRSPKRVFDALLADCRGVASARAFDERVQVGHPASSSGMLMPRLPLPTNERQGHDAHATWAPDPSECPGRRARKMMVVTLPGSGSLAIYPRRTACLQAGVLQ